MIEEKLKLMEDKIRESVDIAVEKYELDWAIIKGIWWRHNRDINATFFYPYRKISQCILALETLKECEKFFQKENIKNEKGTGGVVLDTETGSIEIEV